MIVLDGYIGKGLSRERGEVLIGRHVAQKTWSREPALYRTKWFDYRRLHQAEASCLFAAWYIRHAQAAHARYFDIDEATRARPLRCPNIFELSKQELGGVWGARMAADTLGIPYGFYVSSALEFILDSMSLKHVPRPNQLYGDEVRAAVAHAWLYLAETQIVLPVDPFFHASAYTGHPDQVACVEWLCDRIGRRENAVALFARVIEEGIMDPSIAIKHGGEREIVMQACDFRASLSHD